MLTNRFKSFLIVVLTLFFCVDLFADAHTENKTTSVIQSIPVTSVSKDFVRNNKLGYYYVLALSWSPKYCKNNKKPSMQCKRQAKPYRFILHGLWPSLDKTCTKEKLNENVINSALPFIPSVKLINHEWEKHGRCSGYNPKQYFDLSVKAFEAIKIPPFFNNIAANKIKKVKDIKKLFLQENPKLSYDSIRVININKEFSELRVCLDKSLQATNCPFPPRSKPNNEIVIVPPRM